MSAPSSLSLSLSLSILMAIFPRRPGLTSFIAAKDDGGGGDNWNYKTRKSTVISSRSPF